MFNKKQVVDAIDTFLEKAYLPETNDVLYAQLQKGLWDFLKANFQNYPEEIIDLFWSEYNDWIARLGNDPRVQIRYANCLHGVILGSPPNTDQAVIDFASQLMVQPKDLFKEDTARYLKKVKACSAVPYLIQALETGDYSVVNESGYALAAIQDERAEDPIINIIKRYDVDLIYHDEDKLEFFDNRADYECVIIRHNLFNALCLMKTPKAHQKVIDTVLKGDRSYAIVERGMRYIASLPKDDAEAIFYQLLDSPSKKVREFATENLEDC